MADALEIWATSWRARVAGSESGEEEHVGEEAEVATGTVAPWHEEVKEEAASLGDSRQH